MKYDERYEQAKQIFIDGMKRVETTKPPELQKFKPGTRVKIADDLGTSMKYFPAGVSGTVCYTHAHAFGSDNVKSYCVDVDGYGEISWYNENQLTEEE